MFQRVSLAKLSRRARLLATFFLFARVRIPVDSHRIMHHALRDAKRSSNAWRLRFIVSLCDTIDCGIFYLYEIKNPPAKLLGDEYFRGTTPDSQSLDQALKNRVTYGNVISYSLLYLLISLSALQLFFSEMQLRCEIQDITEPAGSFQPLTSLLFQEIIPSLL